MEPGEPTPLEPQTWGGRLIAGMGRSPSAVAGGLFALLCVLQLGFLAAVGRLQLAFSVSAPEGAAQDIRIGIASFAFIAFLIAAQEHIVRAARRLVNALEPRLALAPEERRARQQAAGRYAPGALRRVGVIGIGVALFTQLLIDENALVSYGFWLWPPEVWVQRLCLPVQGWLIARFLYVATAQARRVGSLARDDVAVDLLDENATAPITRHGLRLSLYVMGFFSFFALLLADADAAPGIANLATSGMGVAAAVAASTMAVPVRGLHAALVAAKERELAWCRAEIERARDAMKGGADARMADWIAYFQAIQAVREWPLDAPTVARFAAYLLLPVISWIGGALMERAVNAVLEP